MARKGWVQVAALCAGAVLAACASSTEPSGAEALGGKWTWVQSSGGLAGRRITPDSAGYRVTLEFNGSRVSTFRNDSLLSQSTFALQSSNAPGTVPGDAVVSFTPPISVFRFDAQVDQVTVVGAAKDTLVLTEPCCDRFQHVFARQR